VVPALKDRNLLDVSYIFSRHVTCSVGYEYIPTNAPSAGHHFFNGNVSYKKGPLTAKAFAGQTSGGTICSGGVCRQRPPYTGAFVETIYNF